MVHLLGRVGLDDSNILIVVIEKEVFSVEVFRYRLDDANFAAIMEKNRIDVRQRITASYQLDIGFDTASKIDSCGVDGFPILDLKQTFAAQEAIQRLNHARRYGKPRLEAACERALLIHSPSYRSVTSILKQGLDTQPPPEDDAQGELPLHTNVRGPGYYH